MATKLLQVQIESAISEKATAILNERGLTLSDALRLLLVRTAQDGEFPIATDAEAKDYDAWFCSKVQEALDDPRPSVSHEVAKAHFAQLRSELLTG